MPKYGIHHIVLQETVSKLRRAPRGSLARQRGDLLADHPAIANLGAIGPDLFFFAPDYLPMQILHPFYAAYRNLQNELSKAAKPIRGLEEELEEAVNDTLDVLENIPGFRAHIDAIKTLVEQIKNLDQVWQAAMEEALKTGIVRLLGLDARDPAYGAYSRGLYQQLFQPGIQANLEEPDWYWFDMLHYRRSGQFARSLLEHAGMSSISQAYALAYLSHIATDVVGHPYVNLICGAPYRMAVQRHVTAENYMDQWKWTQYYPGENIRGSLFHRLQLAAYPDLPDELAETIQKAMMATYANICHPLLLKRTDLPPGGAAALSEGFLSVDDIKASYELLRGILQFMGQNADLRPQPPYPTADEDLAQLNETLDVFDPPPPVSLPPFPNCDWEDIFGSTGGECFEAFVNEMRTWADMVRELMDWAFESGRKALNLIGDSIDHPRPGTPTRWLQLMLYAWQVNVYTAYRAFNAGLAQAGLVYPEPDETNLNIPLARNLITPAQCWGNKGQQSFPRMRPEGRSHLLCPRCGDDQDLAKLLAAQNIEACCELPSTVPAFYDRSADSTPDVFVHTAPFDESAVLRYARARSPQETRNLYAGGYSIGNAIDFTAWLVANADNPATPDFQEAVFCNWNLDGDRGYAYKDWEALLPHCDELMVRISVRDYEQDFAQQFPHVWEDASGRFQVPLNRERYVADKTLADCFLTSLNLSESAIPEHFVQLDKRVQAKPWWEDIVPVRLRLDGNGFLDNIRYVNGIMTNAYSAVQELHQVLRRLEGEVLPVVYPQHAMAAAGKLLHNRTRSHFPLDVWESVPDKLYAYTLWAGIRAGINDPQPMRGLETTTATVALLQHAMVVDKPLFLIGYSQGTLITGAAAMAFSKLGPSQAVFLRRHVKLLHLACIHAPLVQEYLDDIVYAYRAYTNSIAGDPFTLTLANPVDNLSADDARFLANPLSWILQRERATEMVNNGASAFVTGVGEMLKNMAGGDIAEVATPHSLRAYLDILRDDVLAEQEARDFFLA